MACLYNAKPKAFALPRLPRVGDEDEAPNPPGDLRSLEADRFPMGVNPLVIPAPSFGTDNWALGTNLFYGARMLVILSWMFGCFFFSATGVNDE